MSKQYTLEEVKVNTGLNGSPCWIIVRDNVYDVTPYLDDHPGGPELITDWAGKDATRGYDDFGHSGDANAMLKKYKIGELVDSDKKANRNKKTATADKQENGKQNDWSRAQKKKIKFFFCF